MFCHQDDPLDNMNHAHKLCALELPMLATRPTSPAKRPTNLSLSKTLLDEARELEINLSAALDEALAEIVRRKKAERWREENRAAFEAYNAAVEKRGVFSDGLRSF
ncbi:MAG TPA: type II toxin-antitoxin system CcdA family antitoxin [Holophagaceae bacterium]|nr:type II toxin-antitoxin system CcdA family antitoxin [Holophagaceae bacterium]